MYCSEDQDDNEKNKEVVGEEITIYTAEGPKKIYFYGSKDKADKKQKLNEFEKAELMLKAIKDKTIKHKL